MDIEYVLAGMDPNERPDAPTLEEGKFLFVAPAPSELPDDGMLNYVQIASVYDAKDIPERSVVMVAEGELPVLKVWTENNRVFGLSLRALVGLPTADYSVAFDQVTWNLERVAYAPLISEIALFKEQSATAAAASRSVHDIEREQYTRSDGSVREQKGFRVAETVDDGIAEEDGA